MGIVSVDFRSYAESVGQALDLLGAGKILAQQSAILLKPNLVNASPHPVTTAVECCEAVLEYVRARSNAELVIAEGCGAPSYETDAVFKKLGYTDLAQRTGVQLLDLNTAPLKRLEHPACSLFPEMYLPEIAFTHFIISLPVLKAHSIATITGTLKNMMGFAPPKHYSGRFGSWKKAVFHQKMHQAILELNRYRKPDLSLLDASVGLAEFHLGGDECSPPVNKLVAGFNPVEIDREAARLLGLNWKRIEHLTEEL